ncbi:MAG: L-seryl-tRNA(Sec) selenium transferase [Pseudomonadales bacterium]|nr:L-seryl-tRNA(Sec) selenium transferase [Pseudomonadales bacterium]
MSTSRDNSTTQALFRQLPGIDSLLQKSQPLIERWGHEQFVAALREELSLLRTAITAGDSPAHSIEAIQSAATAKLENMDKCSLRPVFNLSGTVLHTNLGRASLPQRAIEAMVMVAQSPSNLEFDLSTGKRDDRESHIEAQICELTGAEAATAVNNNAAAVLLVLNTLAMNQEVPVSRGELVEIGGSFRIPEVMSRSGCTLVEIGATNRTHLRDYEQAINSQTALLMKVHTSNYRVEGFTKSVGEVDLAHLSGQHNLPFVIDLGSGSLIDFSSLGLPDEPSAATSINNGADIITFSGDKLLGGPQAGIIAGRKDLIEKIKKNPLKRALRLDKMTLAALSEVLKLYRNPEALLQELPTLRQLTRPLEIIQSQATNLAPILSAALTPRFVVTVVPGFSQIGSGALPIETLASACLEIKPLKAIDSELRCLIEALRALPIPVIGRLHKGGVLLDLRCLEQEADFVAQLAQLREKLF